ncbi:hypothetical protein KIN20_022169 [Parelaphostrongylus tenuis]|uniref:Uncharacterized protein n=1 Tax=Parelaphostrongylus tenuis TaxID=148309 RepID=A0AAD5MV37_PARTN|nr:hypothetical protein KIN20_022169 [Parelaphostrongylus tenuis]
MDHCNLFGSIISSSLAYCFLRFYFNLNFTPKCTFPYCACLLQVFEIASGTGQHIVHFAQQFPEVTFQPSECEGRSIHSIVSYIDHYKLTNVRVPLYIDVTKPPTEWALPPDYGPLSVDVMININMIHVSSQAAVEGLFKAAGRLLKSESGLLINIRSLCS